MTTYASVPGGVTVQSLSAVPATQLGAVFGLDSHSGSPPQGEQKITSTHLILVSTIMRINECLMIDIDERQTAQYIT